VLDRILIVCVGNICRSPMAEALLRERFTRRGKGRVESAGLAALVGHAADPFAQALMAERGLDIAKHRARQLTQALVTGVDLVIAMEEGHVREVEALVPAARGRVHRIGKLGGFDVPDPYGEPRAEFEKALALIERGLDDFEKAFWRGA
jgi:protein-tyrosine phosphatase